MVWGFNEVSEPKVRGGNAAGIVQRRYGPAAVAASKPRRGSRQPGQGAPAVTDESDGLVSSYSMCFWNRRRWRSQIEIQGRLSKLNGTGLQVKPRRTSRAVREEDRLF